MRQTRSLILPDGGARARVHEEKVLQQRHYLAAADFQLQMDRHLRLALIDLCADLALAAGAAALAKAPDSGFAKSITGLLGEPA